MTAMCNLSLCRELVGDPYFFWSVVKLLMLPITGLGLSLHCYQLFFASSLGSSNSQGEHKSHVAFANIL